MIAVDLHPRTLDFADDASDQLRHAAHRYRLELGWTTTVHDSGLALELDDDVWGLQMPIELATHLVTELHGMDLSCPVVGLPDHRAVVLLEPVRRQEPTPPFPSPVGTLPAGHRVPLPPSVTPRGPVRWLTAHEPDGIRRPAVRTVADALVRLV